MEDKDSGIRILQFEIGGYEFAAPTTIKQLIARIVKTLDWRPETGNGRLTTGFLPLQIIQKRKALNTREAYNDWASQYDTNENKTRDREAIALRKTLENIPFEKCLEIGCGTGKNTEWLARKAKQLTAIDFSEEMIAKAQEKIVSPHVQFKQADITKDWNFVDGLYDLVTFSLVLEHIENLDHIFNQASRSLSPGGSVYIGELHPFKQYTGTKARFETGNGLQVLECFDHHISDFVQSAKRYGLIISDIDEYFDDNERTAIPRILVIVLSKPR